MQSLPIFLSSTEVHGWRNKLGVWVGNCFFPNDISGLRRPKNIKFGTKAASSARMMYALRFLEKVFYCGKICKKMTKRGQKWQTMRSTEDPVT